MQYFDPAFIVIVAVALMLVIVAIIFARRIRVLQTGEAHRPEPAMTGFAGLVISD